MSAPLEVEVHGDIRLVKVTGDVDLTTADAVRKRCLEAMSNDCTGLIVDLSGSDYLDSAGVRALFAIAQRLAPHRQRLALVVPPEAHTRRVLAIVDIESSASLHETTAAALRRLRGPVWEGGADA